MKKGLNRAYFRTIDKYTIKVYNLYQTGHGSYGDFKRSFCDQICFFPKIHHSNTQHSENMNINSFKNTLLAVTFLGSLSLAFSVSFLAARIKRLEVIEGQPNSSLTVSAVQPQATKLPTYTYVNSARFEYGDTFSFSYEDPAGGYYAYKAVSTSESEYDDYGSEGETYYYDEYEAPEGTK